MIRNVQGKFGGNLETDENQPKSSNIQIFSYAHHSDSDKSVNFNDVSINEETTSVADFIVATSLT